MHINSPFERSAELRNKLRFPVVTMNKLHPATAIKDEQQVSTAT